MALSTSQSSGGVQSVHRALDVLETVAMHGGTMQLGDVAATVGLPAPTVYRLLRTLVDRGYMRQLPDRSYALWFRLVPLASAAHAMVGRGAETVLADLVAELGESANLAMRVGDEAEYVAQVPANYSMRMFTEVGRRVEMHSTGVGKAILSRLDAEDVAGVVRRRGMTARTPHTLTSTDALAEELARIRERGYSIDDQEQEMGVRCVAVPFSLGPGSWMAVSISGPLTRMTDDVVVRAAPALAAAARRLAVLTSGQA